jgi:energy-coupling factor transporter ATP-binding protein EcfA2
MVTMEKSRVLLENIPPEEMVFSPKCRRGYMPFISHRRPRTVSDLIAEGYDEDSVRDCVGLGQTLEFQEALSRQQPQTQNLFDNPADESMQIVWCEESYLLMDWNQDGIAELCKVTTVSHATRVLLDGIDLREYDLASLRQAVSVVFQDFVRYDLRFDENIGVGGIEIVGSHLETLNAARESDATRDVGAAADGVHPRIAEAAERSLAASLLPRLPHGYRQMLGRRFEGGADLSGGEWQKVALARAYMRDAQLLILDEPTASLDARAEYQVFLRFGELMAGRTAVLISHRFSTVRMADRIVVLVGGRVTEGGTHEALVARGEGYAELFELQAAGYR